MSNLYNTAPSGNSGGSGLYSFGNQNPSQPPARGNPAPRGNGAPRGGPPPNRGGAAPPPASSSPNQVGTPANSSLYSTQPARGSPPPNRGGATPPPASSPSSGLYATAPRAASNNAPPVSSSLYGAPSNQPANSSLYSSAQAAHPPSRGAPPSRGTPPVSPHTSAAPATSSLYSTAPANSSIYSSAPANANPVQPPVRPPARGAVRGGPAPGPGAGTPLPSHQSSGSIGRNRTGAIGQAPPVVTPVAAPVKINAPPAPIELSDWNWTFKVVRGANLAAKDANGLSDPYLVIELFVGTENNGEWSVSKTMNKTTTPVIKETLNPEWNFDAMLLNADQAFGKFNGVKITCMDKDLVGADDFMGEVYLGFDSDIPSAPTNKTIQMNVKARPKKKDKVSGYLVFESSFQPVPGSAADSNSSNNAMYKSNKAQNQASLKSAAIQKSELVQISATGRREIKVASSLQGGYITYGELPPFELEMDAATQTKHERKYGYNTSLSMWMVTCCQLAYRDATIAGEVARNVWDMYDFQFIDNQETDTQGFCMHNDKFVVVCFRGTESIRDWMTNLNFLMCASPQYPQRYLKVGVRVHTGFNEALSSVWPDIDAFVTKAYRSFPGLKLYICGHSLGGALANLCFSYFVLSDRPRPVAAVYTVGQPRAGNKKFKEQLELAAPNTPYIRVTNNQDCVPSLAGGQHCGVHLHITATGTFTFDPPTWRKAVNKAQSIQGSAASLNYGGLQDHGTHMYRKRIEAHWIKSQMAKVSGDGAFDLCDQALFITDLLTEDVKAVRRYKPQFRAILAQVIKVRPVIEALQDYFGGGVDATSRTKLKDLLLRYFECLSKLRQQVIARHSKKSVLQSAGKNSQKTFNEKMTKTARAFQAIADGLNLTLKNAQLTPPNRSLYSWAEVESVTKWTGANYDVNFNGIDFFAISVATKAKAGEVTHVSKLIESCETLVEQGKLENALEQLNQITSGSGSVGALSTEDQVLVAFLTAKIHAKLHHHNEALAALQSVSGSGLMNSTMFGDSAFATLKNQAGFATLQQNWANTRHQASDDDALVAKMNNFEIHSLSRLFDDADDNGDNFLTTEELQGLLQNSSLDEILDNLGWAEEGVDKTPILNGILADMRRKYHNAADLDQFIALFARLMPH